MVQLGADWVGASGDVGCVFIGALTTLAHILDPCCPSRKVAVTAIKVGDVAGDPVLKGVWERRHCLFNTFPVDLIKGIVRELASSSKQSSSRPPADAVVDTVTDGGTNFDAINYHCDVLIWERVANEVLICNCEFEAILGELIASDI